MAADEPKGGKEPSKAPDEGPEGKDTDWSKLVASLAENEKPVGDFFVRLYKEIVDDYVGKREKARQREREGRAKFVGRVIRWVLFVIGLAVLGTGILTWYALVPPEAFTAVVGTLVGALITFLADHVAPYLYEAEEVAGE